MKNGFRKINKRGLGLFFTAAFFGLGIMLISFFLDTEALFNRNINVNTTGTSHLGLAGSASVSTIQGDQNLFSLKCPLVITPQDHASIRVNVTNSLDRNIIRIFDMTISDQYAQGKNKEVIEMEPGQVTELSWDISTENARYGFLILARAFLHPYSSLPSLSGTCGILVLNIPWITGSQLIWGIIGLCTLGMGIGTFVFNHHNQNVTRKRLKWVKSLLIVAGTVIGGLLLTFMEFWYGTFMITLVATLMIPAMYLDVMINN